MPLAEKDKKVASKKFASKKGAVPPWVAAKAGKDTKSSDGGKPKLGDHFKKARK
jgi:hypothetical protein